MDYSTGSRSGPDCAKLESFESFVRQLVGQTPMSSFAHMLYTLRNAELHEQEERREEQQRKPALGTQLPRVTLRTFSLLVICLSKGINASF